MPTTKLGRERLSLHFYFKVETSYATKSHPLVVRWWQNVWLR